MPDQDRSRRREELRRRLGDEAKAWPGTPLPELRARLAAKLRDEELRQWNEELRQWNEQVREVEELIAELGPEDEQSAEPLSGVLDYEGAVGWMKARVGRQVNVAVYVAGGPPPPVATFSGTLDGGSWKAKADRTLSDSFGFWIAEVPYNAIILSRWSFARADDDGGGQLTIWCSGPERSELVLVVLETELPDYE